MAPQSKEFPIIDDVPINFFATAEKEVEQESNDSHDSFSLVHRVSMEFLATHDSIKQHFPGALTNAKLCEEIDASLENFGFGANNTLVATSLCCDEVNRTLEKDLSGTYGSCFCMGGLAGFPFGGVTSFAAMAHHIPDGGSCLIVYGPHVGVDANGNVGTVNRRGRAHSGACCGSAVAAAGYVKKVLAGETEAAALALADPLDAQQAFVGNMLLPHGRALQCAANPAVHLPYALYEVQKKMLDANVEKGCGAVSGSGKIALLGGIQINTPDGVSDYFLPLDFKVINNCGDEQTRLFL